MLYWGALLYHTENFQLWGWGRWDFVFIKWTLLIFMYLYILYLLVFLLRDDSFSAGLLYCTQNFLHKIFRMGFNFGRKIFIFLVMFWGFFFFLFFKAFLLRSLKLCLPEWEEWTWSFCFSDWVLCRSTTVL